MSKETPDVGMNLVIGNLLPHDTIHRDHGIQDHIPPHLLLQHTQLLPDHDVPFGNHKGKRRLASERGASRSQRPRIKSDQLQILFDQLLLRLTMDPFSHIVLTLLLRLLLLVLHSTTNLLRRRGKTRRDLGPILLQNSLAKELHIIIIPGGIDINRLDIDVVHRIAQANQMAERLPIVRLLVQLLPIKGGCHCVCICLYQSIKEDCIWYSLVYVYSFSCFISHSPVSFSPTMLHKKKNNLNTCGGERQMYPKDERPEETRQKELFAAIKKNMIQGMSDEQIADLKTLGEKFHESFDITTGTTQNLDEISMEESLAYIVESLKSGIHPSYLNEDEIAMLNAGFGEEWYKKWGYSKEDLAK